MKKAKKLLSFVLSLAILMSVASMSGITAYAESTSGTCGANITWKFDEQTGTLTISGSGKMNDLKSTYSTPWNSFKDSIVQVVFSGEITSVGNYAFYEHSNLTNVIFNDGITLIGDYAFYKCEKLESFSFPDSLKDIGQYAFRYCNSIKTIVIPENVQIIRMGAFTNCTSLEEIIVDEDNEFYCNDEYGALYGNDNYGSKYQLIQYPIARNDTFYSVYYPTENIGKYAFSGSKLETVSLATSVYIIGEGAFMGCINLKSIYLSNALKKIHLNAFYGCKSLSDVYYNGESWVWNKINIEYNNDNLLNANIYFEHYCEEEHTFGDWLLLDNFNFCGNREEERRFCLYCGKREINRTGNIVEHKISEWIVVTVADCTRKGKEIRFCERCGEEEEYRYTEPLGHSFTDWIVATEPNCTDNGEDYRYCTVCEEKELRFPEALGHNYEPEVTAPTCTESGYTTYTCVCGDSYIDNYTDATGHDEGEWIVTKPATQTQSGVMDLLCTECGFKLDSKIIDAYGKVNYVLADSISLNYKCSATITPTVNADAGVDYTISYTSSDDSVARIDGNGNVYAAGVGNAVITVTVTDEYGTVVIGTCNADVSYSWWQWIIYVVLFGWLWY